MHCATACQASYFNTTKGTEYFEFSNFFLQLFDLMLSSWAWSFGSSGSSKLGFLRDRDTPVFTWVTLDLRASETAPLCTCTMHLPHCHSQDSGEPNWNLELLKISWNLHLEFRTDYAAHLVPERENKTNAALCPIWPTEVSVPIYASWGEFVRFTPERVFLYL